MKHLSCLLLIFLICCLPSGNLIAQQKKATPKNGEGVELLLKRYGFEGYNYQKEFIRLNKTKLGKNNALILGVEYILPAKTEEKETNVTKNDSIKKSSAAVGTKAAVAVKKDSVVSKKTTVQKAAQKTAPVKTRTKNGYRALYGKNYASFPIISNDLQGACFYLVSGHGGPDPGAMGKKDGHFLHEDEYAYDIVLRLARNLEMRGAKVHIIIQDKNDGIRNDLYLKNSKIETCMGATIPLNQVSRLKQRCVKINSLYAKDKEKYKRALFFHLDSRSKSKRMDVFFYHSGSKLSKKLANTLRTTFRQKYAKFQPKRGFKGTVSKRNLYVLNNTKPVAAFAELGNIQNSADQQRFILSSNRQALAEWLSDALVKDYRDNKKH